MTPERRLEILTRTRSLLDHPSKWGQHTMVQHPLIDRLMMRPPRMCLVAAIYAAIHGIVPAVGEGWDLETSEVHDYLWELVGERPPSPYGRQLMTWQDRVDWPQVDALLDLAVLEAWLDLDSAPNQPDDGADDQQHDQDCHQHE